MTELRRRLRSPYAEPLLWTALGLAGGMLAIALIMLQGELRALIAVVALVGAFVSLALPRVGLYLVVAAMIAQWPGGVIRIAGLAIVGSAFLWGMATRRELLPRNLIFYVQLLLTGVVWASTFSIWEEANLTITFAYTSFLALTWSLPILCDSPQALRRLVATMLLSGVVIALIGFVQYRFPFVWVVSAARIDAETRVGSGETALDSLTLNETLRVESLTGTPNYLALTMQILLPFAVYWTLEQRTWLGRIGGALMVLAFLGATVLSLTRGVLLVLALVTVPLLMLQIGLRRTLPWVGAASLLGLIGALAWSPIRERIVSTLSDVLSLDPQTAAGWRLEAIPIAWNMFIDHFWTGVGIGQQRSLWRSYAPTYIFQPGTETMLPVHNAYLLIGIDLGIVGLSLFIALVVLGQLTTRSAAAHFRATGQEQLQQIAQAAGVAWASLAVSNMLYPGLDSFRYAWLLLALIVAIGRIASEQRERTWEGAWHDG